MAVKKYAKYRMSSFFDIAATTYDNTFTNTKIGKAQREKVYRNLQSIFLTSEKLTILEVNCGTGEDALEFDKRNHKVVATDISENMVEIAKHKGKNTHVDFHVLDCNALSEHPVSKSKYDIIFSNFGGLNCLSYKEMQDFIQATAGLLKPSGKLIMVLMPKNCFWERLYFSIKGNFKNATRRNTNDAVSVNVDGTKVPTWYYNPKDIMLMKNKKFSLVKYIPIGISVPPSYLEKSFITKFPIWNIIYTVEKYIHFGFLAKYADHFLIELQKR
ncbi:class I SAM-dependent methyltransferase [Aquimarina sp. 2201CG1-2-11]|uniref:class I SAM-dependent methyltransferase n=1 Tax=Aquimarina discodermiae TaxID=3231043 RepID=UPI003462EEF0